MSMPQPPSRRFATLVEHLYEEPAVEDSSDAPSDMHRAQIMQLADAYAGRMRFAAAKRDLARAKRQPSTSLSQWIVDNARGLLDQLAKQEPHLSQKFSLAYRNGKDVPEEEVLEILQQLQDLGVDLSTIKLNSAK